MAEDGTKEPDGGKVEEKKATPPSSVSDGYNQFLEKQSATKKDGDPKKEDPSADKEKQLSKEKEGDKGGKTPAHKPVYFVDEDGNKIPFTMTVDGKLIEVTDPEKLRKYGQLGYHSDTKGKDLNERELKLKESEDKHQLEIKAFAKGQQLLEKIQKGLDEGRLVMKDPASKVKEETPEIDEELYSDPGMLELKKENLALGKSVEELKGQVETTNKILLGKLVEEQHSKIIKDMEALKPTYGLADEDDVWDALALQNEDGTPKHTVEEAMKMSQEKEKIKFDGYIKADPDFAKLSEEQQKEVIKDYLEKKAKREEAPVGGPSGSPAGSPKGGKEDRSKWRGRDFFEAGAKMVNERMAAAKKS